MGLISPAGQQPAPRGLHTVSPLRKLFFGRPTPTERQEHSRLPKILALPVFASDAISSSVYATQEILLALSVAGTAALAWTLHISLAISILLIIVAISYTQTVLAYPTGGGSYIVAKDNIGVQWGLVAAAALLIDYILTVATSIASGVQNLVAVPFFQHGKGHEVAICVAFVLLLLLMNLRGLKESGSLFAIPTYLFVACAIAMIFFGLAGPALFGWHLGTAAPPPPHMAGIAAAGIFGPALLLNAFSRGCAAMTGTEAISNGVPAFQKPEARNAAITLGWMAAILGVLFVGISTLAVHLHVVYTAGSEPVIDQLNSIVFGKGSWFYYVLQAATVAILVLAANTSFADFPRLSAILARDGFMPRQLAHIGDKLTFQNGIFLLGLACVALLVLFGGSTDRLIPLYAIGVFVAFTLSQSGMVIHWFHVKGRGWQIKAVINGIGAAATFVVLCTIAYEKVVLDIVQNRGREFGWIILVLIALMYWMFRSIERHYAHLRAALSMERYRAPEHAMANTVIIMVPRIHRGVMPALEYARAISGDVRAVHIESDESRTPRLKEEWERWGGDIPLVILPSPYRSVIGPLLAYLDEVERERPDTRVTVVVPESVTNKWWHSLLHANYGAWMKLYLLNRKNVIVANVRYFVDDEAAASVARSASARPAAALSPDTAATVPPEPAPANRPARSRERVD
jgi:amino acid transporter